MKVGKIFSFSDAEHSVEKGRRERERTDRLLGTEWYRMCREIEKYRQKVSRTKKGD